MNKTELADIGRNWFKSSRAERMKGVDVLYLHFLKVLDETHKLMRENDELRKRLINK